MARVVAAIPLTVLEELMDASIAVGGVAGLALDAEDLAADGDLVVGGDGALIDPGCRVQDAFGVEVVDGEASVAGHGCGVERVVVEVVLDHEGLANVFAYELEGVHGAERAIPRWPMTRLQRRSACGEG